MSGPGIKRPHTPLQVSYVGVTRKQAAEGANPSTKRASKRYCWDIGLADVRWLGFGQT
ncbi:hypothetical protein DPMN_113009 [Dreissena polymorpha]|uniref:Uncharacterized protein n=1 Tax=Dreissena polymorpha TaxID=45954 RepID=A0A9D4KHY3_DREPO|nr:hypothetical protein DPMN_113009 [Dreissena polymorpha]